MTHLKKIGIVAGILIAILIAPSVSFAAQIDTGYVQGTFHIGSTGISGEYATSTVLYNQYTSGLPVGVYQILPPSLSGPISTFVTYASAGTYACLLRNETTNASWADNAPLSNGVQVLCDFTSHNISFNATSTYSFSLYHAGAPYSASVVVQGSSAFTGVFVAGYDNQKYATTLASSTVWVNGGHSTSPILTLTVAFSSASSSPFYAYDFNEALGETCDRLDVFCQAKTFLVNLISPSATVREGLAWNSFSFHDSFPFALFYGVVDVFDSLSSVTATTTGDTAFVPLGTGVASSSIILPSIASTVSGVPLFGQIRGWILILLKVFVVMWTLRIILNIVGIGGSVGSGGRILQPKVGGEVIRHTRNWN